MQAQNERNEEIMRLREEAKTFREILRLREEGKTFREIADRYGIKVCRAQQIYEKQRRIRDEIIRLADKPGPWKMKITV